MAKKKKAGTTDKVTGKHSPRKKEADNGKLNLEDLRLLLRPLGDRVIVVPDDADTTTPGGIVLPDSAKEVPQAGTVLRVGPGKRIEGFPPLVDHLSTTAGTVQAYHRMDVREGDRVYFNKFAGVDVKLSETTPTLKLLREDDVLAVMGE